METSRDPAASASLDLLAERARAGDEAARSTLFDDLGVRLRDVAKRRVREDELDDVVQDALGIVLSGFADRPGPAPILPWTFAVLRNVIGNRYQARRREERGVEFREEEHATTHDPLAAMSAAQVRERVAGAIADVARSHRRCGAILRALLASLEEGGTPREISQRAMETARETLGDVTSGNYHVLLHRCRGRLRSRLAELGREMA